MATKSGSAQFHSLAQRFLDEYHALFPQDASEAGLHQYDADLGGNGAGTHLAHRRLLQSTLHAVEALCDIGFDSDDWLDRRGLLALLRTALFYNEREHWRINPQTHCDSAVHAIFILVVRNATRLPRALPAIESRLGKIPEYLSEGAGCVRRPVPLWTKLAAQTCAGAQQFLAELGPTLASISPTPERTLRLARDAGSAFAGYARAIERKEPGDAKGYSIGRQAFEYMVRERTGLPYSLPEISALGDRLVAELTEALRIEARKFGRKTAASVIEAAAARWEPAGDTLLEEYRRSTVHMRDRFRDAGIVSFPKGERCDVSPVPAFLRHQFPTAAYNQPGAFDKDQTGIFWVNDLSHGVRDPGKKKQEIQQHYGLEFTCAHEAYPGHHLQFVVQNQHPSRLRRLFHHAIFYEGWTLWCEKMAVDQGIINSPEARLIQLQDALWRAHRIGIDCGLHEGSLTFPAACKRLEDGVGFTRARARGDVNWYTSSPTVPMSYLLGRLEVERLHGRLVNEEKWSLRKFNDWILSFGAIPWSWIWQSRLRTPV